MMVCNGVNTIEWLSTQSVDKSGMPHPYIYKQQNINIIMKASQHLKIQTTIAFQIYCNLPLNLSQLWFPLNATSNLSYHTSCTLPMSCDMSCSYSVVLCVCMISLRITLIAYYSISGGPLADNMPVIMASYYGLLPPGNCLINLCRFSMPGLSHLFVQNWDYVAYQIWFILVLIYSVFTASYRYSHQHQH